MDARRSGWDSYRMRNQVNRETEEKKREQPEKKWGVSFFCWENHKNDINDIKYIIYIKYIDI